MLEKKILKNKIRLLSAPLGETRTAALLALFKVGSRYESDRLRGVSHFIEHMMFKGTAKRPRTLDLSKELDGVGAEYNAFTGKDYTGYYVKADSRHLSLAIEILSDMLLHSKFEAKEMEREKGVIVEEINMYEDNPLMYVEDLVEQVMFEGNDLGPSIAGSRETVRSFKRADTLAYKNRFYTGANLVLSVAGRFEDRQLAELAKKFGSLPAGHSQRFQAFSGRQTKPRVKLLFRETEQTQIALGLPAFSYFDPLLYAWQLLTVILGGNMSSRLFLSVRERQGLAYFVKAFTSVYEDAGGLIIQAGLDKIRIDQAVALILKELKKITQNVGSAELSRAKEYLAGKAALDLEDSSQLAQWYAQQELLTGATLTLEQKIEKIMSVSREDIKRAAKRLVDFRRLNLSVIGPFKDDKRFLKLIAQAD